MQALSIIKLSPHVSPKPIHRIQIKHSVIRSYCFGLRRLEEHPAHKNLLWASPPAYYFKKNGMKSFNVSCVPQLETWRVRWWSLIVSCLSQMKASQMLTYTVTAYVLSTVKQSEKEKWILYQAESLKLHHLISHHLKVCCLGRSAPHLPSCVLVTVGFWTVTRPASPAAYQMFVQSVQWHRTA